MEYYPPSENLPIFDVSVFRSTNDNVLTQDDANSLYLSRQGTASSIASSTSFQNQVTIGGNLTLTAPTAANRQIEGSFLKLVDNASISTNKPLVWYPDPSLQITTNDFVGAVKTIDFKSFDGTGTNTSTSVSCKYGECAVGGTLKIGQNTTPSNNSTLTMGAFNLTVTNNNATGNILLNTTAGAIVANSPIVPSDIPPALVSSRPSIGYTWYGSVSSTAIPSTAPINVLTAITFPIGTYMFEASVTCVKSTCTFATTSPLSSTRLSYVNTTGVAFVGVSTGFENAFANDQFTGIALCGCIGATRIVQITTASQITLTFQANWATISGSPTFAYRWSIIRIG